MPQPIDDQLQELHAALEEFEACVQIPFVPGEMERWMADVENAWGRLLPMVNWVLTVQHPQQYAEIRQEDQELVQRIEQMQQEDAELEASATRVGERIPTLTSAVSIIEPNEAKLKPSLDAFVDDALQLVIRIRKQEQAVRTWFLEAFNRDRGTVD